MQRGKTMNKNRISRERRNRNIMEGVNLFKIYSTHV
jgi:hypothetical protein